VLPEGKYGILGHCGKKFKKERFFPVAFAASFGHIAAVAATSRGERV
jgi:hypothetical protein